MNTNAPSSKWNKMLPKLAAICAAGVLAGTFAFAVNVNHTKDAPHATVTTALSIACGAAHAPLPLDKAGIDSTRALGIVLLQPSKLEAVCDVVHQALSDTLLNQEPGTTPKSNNQELYSLADALGIDAKLAATTVAKTHAQRPGALESAALAASSKLQAAPATAPIAPSENAAPFAPAPDVIPEAPSPSM